MAERIRDYATGKPVALTAEEVVRQHFEHILIDDLGYPRSHIDIEFPIQRGARRRAESLDIGVFRSPTHTQKNLLMVVETEPPGHVFDDQLFSYWTATTAELGVWFDGLDRKRSKGAKYFWRDIQNAPTEFVEIPALPRYGESLEEIGKYKKWQLRPAKSLKARFQRMHNRLYGEGPLKREDTIAQEVIKLLFCKLYDELHSPGDTCEFRATVSELRSDEGRARVAARVRNLYQTLGKDPHYAGMFAGEELQYDEYWISYIVSELQGIGLTHEETDTDAMGDAYEVFVGPQLKGESGQFFTPRSVVRLAVDIMQPSLVKREGVIDPACGSGGFLIYALRAAAREAREHYKGRSNGWVKDRIREYASTFMAGMDVEPLLYKVAKSYMAVVGNGRAGIFREDALLAPTLWRPDTKARIGLGKFDILMTNPPFGTRIKVELESTLHQYDLAHALANGERRDQLLRGGQDPAILFLERSWQLLREPTQRRPGGRMAIVLPRQILSGHDRTVVEIRKWILRNMRILAVVDLPPETFQPHTGTITSLFFAERISQPSNEDYSIFMAVGDYVGHDRRGNPMSARNADGTLRYDANNRPILLDDTSTIAAAYLSYQQRQRFKTRKPSIFAVRASEIARQPGHRMDAWYYDPTKNDVVKQIWDMDGTMNGQVSVRTIGHLVRHPSDVFYPGRHKRNYCPPGADAVPFLSGTNILQVRPFDVKWQPKQYKPIQKHLVEKGWILVTRSGSVGRVVYVGDEVAGFPVKEGVAVSEHVIRVICDPEEVDPGYLFAFLATDSVGRVLLSRGIYASVVRHITPEHIREIAVPLPPRSVQKAIGDGVRAAENSRGKANMSIRAMQELVERAVREQSFNDSGAC